MSILKSKSSKTEDSKPEGKQSLALALNVQRQSKRKGYANGGSVDTKATEKEVRGRLNSWLGSPEEPKKEEKQHIIDVPGPGTVHMAHGGEVEEHYDSIADAILRKKHMATGGEVEEPAGETLEDLNEDAVDADIDLYDDLNEEAAEAPEDRIDTMRKRVKAKRGE